MIHNALVKVSFYPSRGMDYSPEHLIDSNFIINRPWNNHHTKIMSLAYNSSGCEGLIPRCIDRCRRRDSVYWRKGSGIDGMCRLDPIAGKVFLELSNGEKMKFMCG